MNLAAVSIRQPVLTWMLSLVLVLFGFISYQRIGVDRMPRIDFPVLSVATVLPGADPDIVDASVTNIVESAVNSVSGIESIRSSSLSGVSVVLLQFDLEKDIDTAFNEVQAKLNEILQRLPSDAMTPVLKKVEVGAQPILWLALQGDNTLQQLNVYARNVIKKQLETIPGVGDVVIAGERRRTIRVNIDLDRLAAQHIGVDQVIRAFGLEHVKLPGGFITSVQQEHQLKLDLEYHSVAALAGLIVTQRDGLPVHLADIATLEDGLEDFRRYASFNGRPAVGLGLVKIAGSNTVAIIDEAERRLDEVIRPQLPPSMRLTKVVDDASLIHAIVTGLKDHLIEGTVLAALVVWLFLRSLRSTLIVATAIPVSLLGAIAGIYFAGLTFNTMTLLGLLLLIGVVVDDAIVVLENVFRHMETRPGEPSAALAEQGTNQVLFAVLASTLTLVSLFGAVVFMGGIIGRFIGSFAVVVVIGVLISLFVSLTLTPMLCARHLRIAKRHGVVFRWLEGGFVALENGYRRLLSIALRQRLLVLLLAVITVYSSGWFVGQLGKGFVPDEDEGRFIVSIKTPLGSSIDYTIDRLRAVEAILRRHDEIQGLFSTIGTGDRGQVNQGEIYVSLKPRQQRQHHQKAILETVRDELAAVPGITAFASPVPIIGGQRGEPLQFVLKGPNLEKVAELATELNHRLRVIPEIGTLDTDLQLDMPQLRLTLDREKLRRVNLDTFTVANTLRVLVGGLDVAKYNDDPGDGERYDIRLKAEGLRTPADLNRIFIRNRNGDLVRLDTVASLEPQLGAATIGRYNLQYAATFFATPTIPEGDAAEIVQAEAAKILPPGYRVELIGRAKEFSKTVGYILFAFATGLTLVYMTLASQFNSFIQPLIVMTAQPLAIVGGVFALWLGGESLNIYSMIGMVLLVGLVAKNSILLIDLTNQLRRHRGANIDDALRDACPLRMRPVLMTSLTIILSMLPAALGVGAGSDTNRPLAVAVIGGMVSSTLLTLVVVPVVYSLVENGMARLAAAKHDGVGALWRRHSRH